MTAVQTHPFRAVVESGGGAAELAKLFAADVIFNAPMLTFLGQIEAIGRVRPALAWLGPVVVNELGRIYIG